jgi:putative glutamine amidotransferase
MLKIGLSSCFFHADSQRPVFKGKTLLYLEQSISSWLMNEGVLAYMIPAPTPNSPVALRDYAWDLDGLVLQGGSDVSPSTYGEKPLKPEWSGDPVRDRYEIELAKEFMACNKPVLGVCRGLQLINVLFGGTLYQDIESQVKGAKNHRNWEIYDQNFHEISFENDSKLARLHGSAKAKVNTVHHQGIKDLGKGLTVEARSTGDGIIEAVRGTDEEPYIFAVQWHPEFHDSKDRSLLDSAPLLKDFLQEAKRQRS